MGAACCQIQGEDAHCCSVHVCWHWLTAQPTAAGQGRCSCCRSRSFVLLRWYRTRAAGCPNCSQAHHPETPLTLGTLVLGCRCCQRRKCLPACLPDTANAAAMFDSMLLLCLTHTLIGRCSEAINLAPSGTSGRGSQHSTHC